LSRHYLGLLDRSCSSVRFCKEYKS
jgi:hypothetical protein